MIGVPTSGPVRRNASSLSAARTASQASSSAAAARSAGKPSSSRIEAVSRRCMASANRLARSPFEGSYQSRSPHTRYNSPTASLPRRSRAAAHTRQVPVAAGLGVEHGLGVLLAGVDVAQRDEPPADADVAQRGDATDPHRRQPGKWTPRVEEELEVVGASIEVGHSGGVERGHEDGLPVRRPAGTVVGVRAMMPIGRCDTALRSSPERRIWCQGGRAQVVALTMSSASWSASAMVSRAPRASSSSTMATPRRSSSRLVRCSLSRPTLNVAIPAP